jgi:hypothetical protein
MVATCCDHVAGWAIWWASDYFLNKIYLSSCNHVLDAWDVIEHLTDSLVMDVMLLDSCYGDVEDLLDPAM